MALSSNLTTFSDVTDGAPLSPAYLSGKFGVLDKNIVEINSSNTLTVGSSGTVGQMWVAGLAVKVGSTSSHPVQIVSNNTVVWEFNARGHFSPVDSPHGMQDIGGVFSGVTLSVRSIFVQALYSMGTQSAVASLGTTEMGLVFTSSGMSLLVRSLDTVYDIGSATSAAV